MITPKKYLPEATVHTNLSRRERQIMDVLYAGEELTAAEIQQALPGSPSYSTVRALMKKLMDKGHVDFRTDGPRYVYRPVLKKEAAADNALTRLVEVFYRGSAIDAVLGLLGREKGKLTPRDLDVLEATLAELSSKEPSKVGRSVPRDNHSDD